ncbi:MAG: hypothetical protein KJP04_01165, partial [Arenicella sp.]|nr:hypothetical protein [Arenicella sp.]
ETGGDALTGAQCFRDWLPVADGYPDFDADACGTVTKSTTATRDMFSVTLPCADLDSDELAEVSTCLSWKQSSDPNDCPNLLGAVPGGPAKCRCGVTDLDGLPIPELTLSKVCTPDEIVPGGTINCTVTIMNNALGADAVGFHFEDDYPEDYGSVINASITQGSVTDNGDILTLATGTISAGSSITLTYDFNVNDAANLPNGGLPDSFTNTVETYYTNGDGVVINQGLTASDTTTVPITLSYIIAKSRNGLLEFEWQTQTETGNLGFNLQAVDEANGNLYRINEQLIPSAGINSASPLAYSYSATNSFIVKAFYLEDVDLYGNVTRHGPYQVGKKFGRKLAPRKKIDWKSIRAEHNDKVSGRSKKAKPGQINSKKFKVRNLQTEAITAVKIKVAATGPQRLFLSDLRAAGLDINRFRKRQGGLTDNGVNIPYRVAGDGSYIEFFGRATINLYDSHNYYVFDLNVRGEQLREIKTVKNINTDNYNYQKQLKLAEKRGYSMFINGSDPWYDEFLFAINSPKTASYRFAAGDISATGANARLDLRVYGATSFPEDPDHHLQVMLDGVVIADHRFDGRGDHLLSVEFDARLINDSGENLLELVLTADTPRAYDAVMIQDVNLSYPATLSLDTTPATVKLQSYGESFSFAAGDDPVVYRVAESTAQLIIPRVDRKTGIYTIDKSISTNDNIQYDFYLTDGVAVARASVGAPIREPIASSDANHLVIAHPDFIGADLDNYLANRSDHLTGDQQVIDVSQIYAEYSDHEVDPEAIREFVRLSSSFGNLRSVMLVGGDTYDYRDYLGYEALSFIPTFYLPTSELISQTPSDALFTDVNNDNISDFAIGRLAVRNNAELKTVLDKSLTYWRKNYSNTALLIADKDDLRNNFQFSESISNFALALDADDWAVEEIALQGLDDDGIDAARTATLSAMNNGINEHQGTSLVLFSGHSSPYSWTFSGLFGLSDVPMLNNQLSPFSVVQWGCWNTYFVDPIGQTLGHELLSSGPMGAA